MRLRTSPVKWVAVGGVGAFVLAVGPRTAWAQSVALTQGAVIQDYLSDGVTPSAHPNNVDSTWISFADCENDVRIRFPLTLTPDPSTGFTAANLQAWASVGQDCTAQTNREPPNLVCWQVVMGSIPSNLSLTQDITVRNIIQYIGNTAAIPAGGGYHTGTESACHVVQTSGPIAVTVQFIWFPNGNPQGAMSVSQGLNVEMIGPAPPTGISAGPGGNILIVNWLPVNDPNTKGFNVFLDPMPGHEGAVPDAGGNPALITDASCHEVVTCPDTGASMTPSDGAITDGPVEAPAPVDSGMCTTRTVCDAEAPGTSGACPSTVLVTGVTGSTTTMTPTPTTTNGDGGVVATSGDGGTTSTVTVTGTPPSASVLANNVVFSTGDGTATTTTLTGLKDGVNYTVTVAAIDNLNDNGPLGLPSCATPGPVQDFWDNYTGEGGGAGGSFCALEGAGIPTGVSVFGLGMLGVVAAWIRRRRGR